MCCDLLLFSLGLTYTMICVSLASKCMPFLAEPKVFSLLSQHFPFIAQICAPKSTHTHTYDRTLTPKSHHLDCMRVLYLFVASFFLSYSSRNAFIYKVLYNIKSWKSFVIYQNYHWKICAL